MAGTTSYGKWVYALLAALVAVKDCWQARVIWQARRHMASGFTRSSQLRIVGKLESYGRYDVIWQVSALVAKNRYIRFLSCKRYINKKNAITHNGAFMSCKIIYTMWLAETLSRP